MKTPIAITLIIMGALLIMTPAFSDYLYQRNVVELMNRPGVSSVTLGGQMTELYRFGCWLSGSAMAGFAILCSIGSRKSVETTGRAATLPA
jgi:hypothetical protein